MISLRRSREEELVRFVAMEQQAHAKKFIHSGNLQEHKTLFSNPEAIYLSIDNEKDELCGYFILFSEPGADSVEFRRVLIDQDRRGIGQIAIGEMEDYCRKKLKADRIWLDVYEDNRVGRHIYEKMGYAKFKESRDSGRKLLFYQKSL